MNRRKDEVDGISFFLNQEEYILNEKRDYLRINTSDHNIFHKTFMKKDRFDDIIEELHKRRALREED